MVRALPEGIGSAAAELHRPGYAVRSVVRALAPPPAPDGNVYALLAWANALAERAPALLALAVPMARAVEAFDRPLLVAVMGEFNAGKSSFVNSLAGDAIAPVGVTPTTATINVLRFGPGGGRAIYNDGTARELAAPMVGTFLGALGDREAAAIRQIEIFAPLESLRRVEIVDTPGLNSLRPEHEKVARDFLIEADAIVWVFAAGQAAKATEREALALARAAGKKVLGVINKIDRASAEEIAEVVRHVEAEMGALVETVVPLSARAGLAARRAGDADGLAQTGLAAVEAELDGRFFARARELKRATALGAMRRFVADARAALAITPAAADDAGAARAALDGIRRRLRSVIASERVRLRARLDEGFRSAAVEVREFVRPRSWPFGEHRAEPADEAFLGDVLEDGVRRATESTRLALVAALSAPDGDAPLPPGVAPTAAELAAAFDDAIERFRAYARGIIEGAAAVFLRIDLPSLRLDLGAIHNALGRWTPDPEELLFRTIERAVAAIDRRADAELGARDDAREVARLIQEETVSAPIDALARAVDALAATSATT